MLIIYVVLSLLIGLVAYHVVNPYGHLSKANQWAQTIVIALLWPFLLLWVVGFYLYYTYLKGD